MTTNWYYRDIVVNCGVALAEVPVEFRTPDLCLLAVKLDSHAVASIPAHLLDEAFCQQVLECNAWALQYLPREQITHDLCLHAIEFDPRIVGSVPAELQDHELITLALARDPFALSRVDPAKIDVELCLEAVRLNGLAVMDVPDGLLQEVVQSVLTAGLPQVTVSDIVAGCLLRNDAEQVRVLLQALPALSEADISARLTKSMMSGPMFQLEPDSDPSFLLLSRLAREMQLEAAVEPAAGHSPRPRL